MTSHFKHAAVLSLGLIVLLGCHGVTGEEYRSPDRFEEDIQKFEKADAQKMPPEGAVLCVGSSSIRLWHNDLAKDLSPLTIIGRGFGGSNTNDLLHYSDRIIFKYKPRAIVIYEGDNDVSQGIEPKKIVATYTLLLDKIEKKLPGCRVYVLAVKPSPQRWELWPKMQEVNRAYAELAHERKAVTYIDVASPLLNEAGEPRTELYKKDQLHLNRAGYDVWREAIRPVLVKAERGDEQP